MRNTAVVILIIAFILVLTSLYFSALQRASFRCSAIALNSANDTEIIHKYKGYTFSQDELKTEMSFIDIPVDDSSRGLMDTSLSWMCLYGHGIVQDIGIVSFEKEFVDPKLLLVCQDYIVIDEYLLFANPFFKFSLDYSISDINGDGYKDFVFTGERYMYSIAWINNNNESFDAKPRIIIKKHLSPSLLFILSRIFVIWIFLFLIGMPVLLFRIITIRNRLLVIMILPVFAILFYVSRIFFLGNASIFIYMSVYFCAILYIIFSTIRFLLLIFKKNKSAPVS